MQEQQCSTSEKIAGFGILLGIVAAVFWAVTNCEWWEYSFCDDSGLASLIGTMFWILLVFAFILFLAGGIAREIDIEGKMGAVEEHDEARREHERRSITSKPPLPNLMIIIGLILIFGISTTLLGAFDSGYSNQSFYRALNWVFAGLGTAMVIGGHYMKRKKRQSKT